MSGLLEKELSRLGKKEKDQSSVWIYGFYASDSLRIRSIRDSMVMLLTTNNVTVPKAIKFNYFKTVGSYFAGEGEYDKAIDWSLRARYVAVNEKDLVGIAEMDRSIGVYYMKFDNNLKAREYLLRSYAQFVKLENEPRACSAAMSLGNAYKDLDSLDMAQKYYDIGLEIAKKYNNKKDLAGLYNNLGNLSRKRKNYKEALGYHKKAMELNRETNNDLWLSFNYHNLGNIYNELKNYDNAIRYLNLSKNLKAQLKDSFAMITTCEVLASVYHKVGDYAGAYDNLNIVRKLEKKWNLDEQSQQIASLEAKYQSEIQEAEINRLTVEQDLQKERNINLEKEASNNSKIAVLSIVAVLMAIFGLFYLYRSNQARKRANDLLSAQKEDVQRANNQLEGALKELSIKNKEIIDSINYATYIQRASLPNIKQNTSELLSFEIFFSPKDIVSGDFYFSYNLYQKSVFGVADCTGHGVPGAMVSLIGMNSLDKVIREEKHKSTGKMLTSLNEHVKTSLHRGDASVNDGMDISFCVLDHESEVLSFSGAHHNAFILRKMANYNPTVLTPNIVVKERNQEHVLLQLEGARRPIGESPSKSEFFQVDIMLEPMDRIVLFSDGYADQVGSTTGKKLKKGAFLSFIMASANLSLQEQISELRFEFQNWKGELEQVDDVCVLISEYSGK